MPSVNEAIDATHVPSTRDTSSFPSQPANDPDSSRTCTNTINLANAHQTTGVSHLHPDVLTPATSNSTTSPEAPNPNSLLASALEPSPEEAEELFRSFRNFLLPYVPYMILGPSMTAYELRQEFPFLWLCIMAITSKSASQQSALSRTLRSNLGRMMLLDGQADLDLLFGTITCIAW